MNKKWLISGGVILVIVLLTVFVQYAVQEPLRRVMESRINGALKGYTVNVGALDFHPIGFSIDLKNIVVFQQAHSDPPVARIPELSASIHWRELLSAHLVSDFLIEDPELYVNIAHITKERKDEMPVEKRGWQHALQSIYPFKINEFRIRNGALTYVPEGEFRPLRIGDVDFFAGNIRNIHAPENAYPSSIALESTVFDSGRLSIKGSANFQATPHVTMNTGVTIEEMDLTYFEPIIQRSGLSVRKGLVSSITGNLEYGTSKTVLHIQKMLLRGIEADYSKGKAASRTAQKVKKATEKAQEKEEFEFYLDEAKIENSTFGFVNRDARPEYRVFISNTEMKLANFSKDFVKGAASLRLHCNFMGKGDGLLLGAFRDERKGADFDLQIAIENTPMQDLNDLFEAHGNFDVAKGTFSLYSEVSVKGGKVDGYVKPIFEDVEVYESEQEKGESILKKIYEGIVGTIAELFERRPAGQVATKMDISGNLEDPKANTMQAVLNLVRNAFFQAILPGFEGRRK